MLAITQKHSPSPATWPDHDQRLRTATTRDPLIPPMKDKDAFLLLVASYRCGLVTPAVLSKAS